MQDQSVQSNYIDDEIQHNNNNSQFSNISDYKFQNYENNQDSYDQQQEEDDDKNVYKQQLFENFKQTGVLNNLKATLRKQLIDKLQSSKQTGQEKDEMQTEKFQKNRFFYERRLLGYMIADFLRKHNFNYTYSVLLPEMQLESENVLQKEEIIEALRITPSEYQELIEIDLDKDLSAMEIVMEVIRKIKCTVKREIHVQTEFEEDKNYKQKLEDVENQALKNMNKIQNTSIKNYEEQFLKYKTEMDRRYQEQLQDEISRLRELEIAELRAHENAEFQMKLKKYKYEMDKLYEEKLKKLKERERTALELCKRRQQEIDRMSFEQRAQHRKAIDDLKQRELELKKHNCLEGEEIKKEREKIKQMEASLKIKMREYDQAKMTINTRIQQDINDRKKIMQKENDLERTSQGGQLIFKNQEEQQRREYRENLQMLETQRQYLTRDLEIVKRDNKELEYLKKEHEKEIQNLRKNIELLRSENDSYQERQNQLEHKFNKLNNEFTQIQAKYDQQKQILENQQEQNSNMHKNYADDILKHQSRTSEVERYYMNKLQEITEQNRYEILGLQNKVQRFEQTNEKLTEENNDLRKELRLARVKDQNKENQEIREKRYMSNEKIQADLEDLGQKEFQDRMQKTQQEFQTQKLKFLEELQNQNY